MLARYRNSRHFGEKSSARRISSKDVACCLHLLVLEEGALFSPFNASVSMLMYFEETYRMPGILPYKFFGAPGNSVF